MGKSLNLFRRRRERLERDLADASQELRKKVEDLATLRDGTAASA